MSGSKADTLCEDIWAVVAEIPEGRVATYGQVAAMAGHPGASRHAGRCLSKLPEGSGLPWHRVVNAAGKISARPARSDCDDVQRSLLEAEGVEFRKSGSIDLRKYRW